MSHREKNHQNEKQTVLTKAQIRKKMKQIKQNMSEPEIFHYSKEIIDTLTAQPEYQNSRLILAYANFNQEVVTIGLLKQAFKEKKMVALPRIDRKNGEEIMNFYLVQSFEDLENGYFSIPEPKGELETPLLDVSDALMIVPGLAFDKTGSRIGYGKGFYDRFLSTHPVKYTIGICYDAQLLDADQIPTEETDMKIQKIITPVRMIFE